MEPTRQKVTSHLNNNPTPKAPEPSPSLMSQIKKSARSFCDAFALAWDRLPSIRKTSAKNMPMKTDNQDKKYEDISIVASKSLAKSKLSTEKTNVSSKKNTEIPKKDKKSQLETTKSDNKLLNSISKSASGLNKTPSKRSNVSSSSSNLSPEITNIDQRGTSPELTKTSSKNIKNLSKLNKNETSSSEPPSFVTHSASKMIKRLSEKKQTAKAQSSQSSQKIETPIIVDNKAKYAVASKLVDHITAHVKESPGEGIFRLSGSHSNIQEIYSKLMKNPESEIPEIGGNTSINDLSGVLKEFLKNNKTITGDSREAYLEVGRSLENEVSDELNTTALEQKLKTAFETLEPSQRQLLKEIVSMCNSLLDENISNITLMKSENLAIALGNSLLELQTLNDPGASKKAFEFLLVHHDKIFS
jgi:hypothetical protein